MATEPITDESLKELVALHAANEGHAAFPSSYARRLHNSVPDLIARLEMAEQERNEWRRRWSVESGEAEGL